MPFAEDLDVFLREDEFAHVCELRLANGIVRQVLGIFDEPHLDAQLDEYRLDTTTPRLLAKAVDFVGVDRGDTITIAGRTFDVMGLPQIDGTGMATLRLSPAHGQGGR
ncbi:head-tail joining protein [Paracoccus yeei]|uniref:head-tail joining protein n=1 Tax=Paracoccus yeei TaxID=147645 RepID=UPI0028D2387D|nr:head-tail joining protein [Paracoccus yeei]